MNVKLIVMPMKFGYVALGGTFDWFHIGHETLIEKAVEIGRWVTIGITSDRFSGKDVEPFNMRKKAVTDFLRKIDYNNYQIVVLEDPFGPAASDSSMEALVVSDETYGRAVELNTIRSEKGLNKLEIIRLPMLAAEDGQPISSSRIRNGEIDRIGRLIKKG